MITKQISHERASEFLLPKHYSGRLPNIAKAYGWFDGNELKAVCTFGKPASNNLCVSICGKEHSSSVYELNRLCRTDNLNLQLSQFVSECLRDLKKSNWIIVSYSDMAMNHHGYIYQACNFIYTGETKERTDQYAPNGKHSRHSDEYDSHGIRRVRSPKHRYIYFCTNDKKLKRTWRNALQMPVLPYPKGDNSNYRLGDFIKEKLLITDETRQWLDEILNE